MTIQAVASLSNRESLCIGEITEREREIAAAEDPTIDGAGLYLLSVQTKSPREPAKVLAKFASEEAALKLAQFFRLSGRMEPAAS